MFNYFILEKKRTFTHTQVQNPYWVERILFFSMEEAEAEAFADQDLYRIYAGPATIVAGTEDFTA